jgi:uncharacterized protein
MKTFFLSAVLLFIAVSSFAQTESKIATMQVVGNSKLFAHPDLGVLIIRLQYKDMNISNAIVGLNNKTKELYKQIDAMGFNEEDIKTLDFQINEHKTYYNNTYNDSGYIASQNVQVEFKNQKEVITKILNTFSKSKTNYAVNISFKLSDAVKSKVEEELIVMAIKDAKKKSKLIASTSEVVLKKIKTINYGTSYSSGVSELHDVQFMKASAADAPGEGMTGFTPNDLLFEDNLSIIWEIE